MDLSTIVSEPRRQTLHDLAYRKLQALILTGKLAPGRRMTNRGLAELLGVSVTPVREALHRLTTEGSLIVLPSGSVMVPVLSQADLQEVLRVSRALEGMAVEEAARRIARRELQRVARARGEIATALEAGSAEEMVRWTYRLHFALFGAAHMPMLLSMIERIWLRRGPYLHLLFPDFAQEDERSGTLERLLEALERHDAMGASALYLERLENSFAHLALRMGAADEPAETDKLPV